MYLFMYVCMYVCMYVYDVCMYVMYICMYVCSMYLNADVSATLVSHIDLQQTNVCMYVYS